MDDATVEAVMAQALIDQGVLTAEQVAAMQGPEGAASHAVIPALASAPGRIAMHVDSSQADRVPPQSQAATLGSDELDELSAAAFAPPARAEQYDLKLPRNVIMAATDVAEAATIRSAFHAAGMPLALVSQIALMATTAAADPPNDMQRAATRLRTMDRLRELHGNETDHVLAVARKEFADLTRAAPSLHHMADRAGLSDSLFLVRSLYANALAKGRA